MALCRITGIVYLPSGEIAARREVTFVKEPDSVTADYLGAVLPEPIRTRTDIDGSIDLTLITGNYYGFILGRGGHNKYTFRAIVPESATADFADLIAAVDPVEPLPAWLQQALQARDEAVQAADESLAIVGSLGSLQQAVDDTEAARDATLGAISVFNDDIDNIYALNYATVADLISETRTFDVGQIVFAGQGYKYEVAPTSATDQNITTAGGVKLYVRPVDGRMYIESFAEVVTEAVFIRGFIAAREERKRHYATAPFGQTLTLVCSSTFDVSNTISFSDSGAEIFGLAIDMANCRMNAVAGGNLGPTQPVVFSRLAWSEQKYPYIDGKRIASCLQLMNTRTSQIHTVRVINPVKLGFGCKVSGSQSNMWMYDPYCIEMAPGDPEPVASYSNYDATAFVCDAADFFITGGRIAWAKVALELTENAASNTFLGTHIWNDGRIGAPRTDTINILSNASGGVHFYNVYLDNGLIIDNGGLLNITGWQLVLNDRIALTDPIIRVKCTQAKSGQSPNYSQYDISGASIGFLPSDVGGYNWGGSYVGVNSLYPAQRVAGHCIDTLREKSEIYTDASPTRVSRSVRKPASPFIEDVLAGSGTSIIRTEFHTTSNGSSYQRLYGMDSVRYIPNTGGGFSVLMGPVGVTIGMSYDSARPDTLRLTHGGKMSAPLLPSSASGLVSGDFWRDISAGNVIKQVP